MATVVSNKNVIIRSLDHPCRIRKTEKFVLGCKIIDETKDFYLESNANFKEPDSLPSKGDLCVEYLTHFDGTEDIYL